MVIFFHLWIIGWVALLWISDGAIMEPAGTSGKWDWLDDLLGGL